MTITINLTSSTGVNFNADYDSFFADFTSTGWPYILGGSNSFQGDEVVLLGQTEKGKETQTKTIILDGTDLNYYFNNHTLSGTLTSVRLGTLGDSYNSDGSFDKDSSGHITNVSTSIEITGLNISNAYGTTGPLHNTVSALMGTATGGDGSADPTLLSSYIWAEAHLVNGSAGGDTYYGTAYGDTVYGNGGNDTFGGRGGNDFIDGGEGTDTAVYSGAKSDYSWISNADGTWTVTDTRVGAANEGVDTLFSIEFLKFSDQTVALVPTGPVNTAPVIGSNGGGTTAAVSVLENTTAVTTVAASDADAGAVIAYSIAGGADAALFQIDAATGVLSFTSAPNYESPADSGANNIYDVVVRATDNGGLYDEQALAVTVTNVPESVNTAPVIGSNGGGATAALSIAENTTAVTTVAASDADAGATLAYSIAGGADAALFQIDAATGALSFKSAPNFEVPADSGANNIYDVVVRATDNGGLYDEQALAVTVTDVPEAILGTAGNDKLTGTAGNDTLDGLAGADTLTGGLGNDTYIVDNTRDKVVEKAGQGTDLVLSSVTFKLANSVENLTLTGFAAINGTGNSAANVLTGNAAANTLSGAGGGDTLIGGLGADTLKGGAGADTFIYTAVEDSTANAYDTISDFSVKQGDKIDLSAIDANAIGGADNDAFVYIGAASFSGTAGELRFSGGFLQGDVNGDGMADLSIKLNGNAAKSLTASNIIL